MVLRTGYRSTTTNHLFDVLVLCLYRLHAQRCTQLFSAQGCKIRSLLRTKVQVPSLRTCTKVHACSLLGARSFATWHKCAHLFSAAQRCTSTLTEPHEGTNINNWNGWFDSFKTQKRHCQSLHNEASNQSNWTCRGGCRKMKGGGLDLASLGLMPQANFWTFWLHTLFLLHHNACFITMPFLVDSHSS